MTNLPLDFGPIYAETNMNRFPVEPWNTGSNLIFLAIFLYWSRKTHLEYRKHKFLTISLPILLIGYIGGTLYHATRTQNIWLMMDFAPISILCLYLSYTYWVKLLSSRAKVLLYIFLPFLLLRFSMQSFLPLDRNLMISIGYSMLGMLIVAPLFIYSRRRVILRKYISIAACFFAVAIFFRVADSFAKNMVNSYFPMGTHWLWHLLGGIASNFAIAFVYEDDLSSLVEAQNSR